MWCGMKINIFHQVDATPAPESMGSIFPVVAPLKVNVKNQGEWNSFRILMDWPRLRVWTNDEPVQDLDRRNRARTAPPPAQRISGPGVALLSHPLPQSARPRTAVESRVDAALRDAAGLRQVARLRWQAAVRAARRRAPQRRPRPPRHAGKVPRFRIADVRAPRLASQRRRPVPHLRTGIARPPLRDPVARRGRRALSHGVAVYHQTRRSIRASKPGNGGCSNCASRTTPAWSASTARP